MKEGSWSISRFKGLGEMNAEQLWETTMNPETRRLVRVALDPKPTKVREIFAKLMGKGEAEEPARMDGSRKPWRSTSECSQGRQTWRLNKGDEAKPSDARLKVTLPPRTGQLDKVTWLAGEGQIHVGSRRPPPASPTTRQGEGNAVERSPRRTGNGTFQRYAARWQRPAPALTLTTATTRRRSRSSPSAPISSTR